MAASTSSMLGRSAGRGARSGIGTPSMRWAVPATSMPSTAVAKATRAGASRHGRHLGSHDELSVDLAALRFAREATREVNRPGEPRLPGEHVLGAAA